MIAFVAMQGDRNAENALRVIEETPWLTRYPTRVVTPQDRVTPEEVAFFTDTATVLQHRPSKWLRIPKKKRKQNPVPPAWASKAKTVIAIWPRDDTGNGDGFATAVRNAASMLAGVTPQPFPPRP